MKITYGQQGLEYTWQEEFPAEVECAQDNCDGRARPALNVFEEPGEGEYVSHLHDNEGGIGGDFWLHDAVAFQIYLCRKCLEPTTRYNQA